MTLSRREQSRRAISWAARAVAAAGVLAPDAVDDEIVEAVEDELGWDLADESPAGLDEPEIALAAYREATS